MTRRRGKETPKHLRAPPRPPNVAKHEADIHAHHQKKREEQQNLESLFARAAGGGKRDREEHLAAFFALHRAKGVERLTYDSDQAASRKYAATLGGNATPTDPLNGPAFLIIDLALQRKREWRYRSCRERPIFITPRAYDLTAPEFENFLVDRLYARAREVYETPPMPITAFGEGNTLRIPRDLVQRLTEKDYWPIADTYALLSQLYGARRRGIEHLPTVQEAAQDLRNVDALLAQRKTSDTYVAALLSGTRKAIASFERRAAHQGEVALSGEVSAITTRMSSPLPSVPQ